MEAEKGVGIVPKSDLIRDCTDYSARVWSCVKIEFVSYDLSGVLVRLDAFKLEDYRS